MLLDVPALLPYSRGQWQRLKWKKPGVIGAHEEWLRKMWAHLTRHERGDFVSGPSQPKRHDTAAAKARNVADSHKPSCDAWHSTRISTMHSSEQQSYVQDCDKLYAQPTAPTPAREVRMTLQPRYEHNFAPL
ncbi:hypothetical protein SNOG_16151 [Parastagonospora nodorum SN15]|uniref:Uncharacterized protein n=1 Tax=Phaeosphaeria nodorum (strain SN15 / ATCC MYA-4574 / FGSC 10173) TaxID=321614 RepID=Q0TWL3_PHANO|nr:hypothetical protein SNOG_16151 [Parastagonospora nodorum SN15]EAT76523.2 hypothetical protein SNOG_16151 [Parastagonospora nodorum SN15]